MCLCLSRAGASQQAALVSVSRQMRVDATAIFFSLNSFLILPPHGIISKETQPLEILRFFSRFAARGRERLRSVTLMLPEIDHMFWGPRALGEWNQVIDICAEELSIERLVFTIDMSYQARRRRSMGLDYSNYDGSVISEIEVREWHAGLSMVESMPGKYDRRHKWNGYNCTCECGDEDW